jgi:pentatricopeptide repeat protein
MAHFMRSQAFRYQHPLWRQIGLLAKYGAQIFQAPGVALQREVAGLMDEPNAETWFAIADMPSLYSALQRLVADEQLFFVDHPLFPPAESVYIDDGGMSPPGPPTWLVMHLVTNRVRNSRDARLALDLVFNQLPHTPKNLQFPLILAALHRMVRFVQWPHVVPVFSKVLDLPSNLPIFHFNELLVVLTRFPRRDEIRVLIKHLLQYMKDTGIRVDRRAALRLTVEAAVYPEIAELLPTGKQLAEMWRRGYRWSSRSRKSNAAGQWRRQRTSKILKVDFQQAIDLLVNPIIPAHLRKDKPWARNLDAYEWSAFLSAMAKDYSLTHETLLAVWKRLKELKGSNVNAASYTAMIDAFRRRGIPKLAVEIWKELVKRPSVVDRRALTAGVVALAVAGHLKEAFETMEIFAYKNYLPGATETPWPSKEQYMLTPGHIHLDIGIINALMRYMNRHGRPDVVFKLWDVMEKYYGTWPDAYTLTFLLDATRHAHLIDPSMEIALAQLGIHNPLKSWRREEDGTPGALISRMLSKPPESGFWHDDWAYVNARVIFRDVVLGNWPLLQKVSCPIGAFIPTTFTDRLWVVPDPKPEQRWPTIIPSATTFHAYIHMLGWNELQAEIPQALAWMRALQMEPMQKTLAMALMYYGEVARLPPLFEAFDLNRNDAYKGDYGRLRRWLVDWVGGRAVPSENFVAAFRRGDANRGAVRWYGRNS